MANKRKKFAHEGKARLLRLHRNEKDLDTNTTAQVDAAVKSPNSKPRP